MTGRDVVGGSACTLVGVAILIVSRQYGLATAADIGPGLFPATAAAVLCSCGVVIAIRAARAARTTRTDEEVGRQSWRAPVAVSVALVAFALLLERAGFLVAAPTLILLASGGDPRSRPVDVLVLAALLTAAAALIFVWSLGLPLPLLPLMGVH